MNNNLYELLLEASRKELINKSKSADIVKSYGTTRYERRNKQHIYNSVEAFNRIDFNALFRANLLSFIVPVHGETDNYGVEVLFEGICDEIKREIKFNSGVLEFKCIYRALVDAVNRKDILIACTCPDWCLEGNTNIKLLNGITKPIKDLKIDFDNGEDLWVYSTDENGDFKPGHVSDIWISGYTKELVKVILDNGREILTTPNHKYMLRDGSYIPAEELQIGQSLMPLYFRSTKEGYETVKLNSKPTTSYYSVYKLVAQEELQSEIESAKIRSGEDIISIHHADFNKANNYPTNLKPMGHQEHYKYHYDHVKDSPAFEKFVQAGEVYRELVKDHSTEEYKKQANVMREAFYGENGYYNNRTEEEKLRDFELHSIGSKEAWARGCFETEKFKVAAKARGEFLHTSEIEVLSAEGVRNYWSNISEEKRSERAKISAENGRKGAAKIKGKKYGESTKNKHREYWYNLPEEEKIAHKIKVRDTKVKTVFDIILSKGEELTLDNYIKYRTSGYPNILKNWETFEDCINYFGINDNYNHKIRNIEYIELDSPTPVYDLSVDKWNNFYVDAGVILHNCYRFAYHASKGGYNGGRPELRAADITNPNDSKGCGCKHVMNVLANLDWVVKLATTIFNYINYMEENQEDKYARLIYPVIYGKPYEKDYDKDYKFTSDEDELADTMDREDDAEVINKANERGEPEYNPEVEEPEEEE